MAKITTAQKNLVIVASVLGMIEAIAWFVMSLLCLIEYYNVNPPEAKDSYVDYFNYYVYSHFLYRDAPVSDGTLITPNAFAKFMWVYAIVDVLWFISSAFLIAAVYKGRSVLAPSLVVWGVFTCLLCCVDLVLVILLGYDYDQICARDYTDPNDKILQNELCPNAMIPVLILAARGFGLWIVNIAFAYIAFVTTAHLTQKSTGADAAPRRMFPFWGRADSTIPRATVQRSTSLYQQQIQNVSRNKGFWNVNLSTAFTNRTPPATPMSPLSVSSSQQGFFAK